MQFRQGIDYSELTTNDHLARHVAYQAGVESILSYLEQELKRQEG